MLPRWPGELARHPLAAWVWLADRAPSDTPTLFAFEATAGYLQGQVPRVRPAPTMGLSSPPDDASPVTHTLCCVSYNVLTLLDKGKCEARADAGAGMRVTGKRHLLTTQFVEEDVLFVGLQETRLQETATLPDSRFMCLHSAATPAGHLGCALWISKVTPYAKADGVSLYFALQHCTVVAFSPRHILVSIEAPKFSCNLLVAHAPSDPKDSSSVVKDFWYQRQLEIDRLQANTPLIVLTDANSRLGSLVSPAVGCHDAETETVAGSLFHDFLLHNQLCLPATFADHHSGASWTWHSVFDTRHRLDYVGIPQTWLAFQPKTDVWYTFESLQQKYDHVPTRLRCQFQSANTAGTALAFARKACRPNDLDPGVDKTAFRRELDAQPLPDWSLDVDSHYAKFVDSWVSAGHTVATPACSSARQFFLTEHTLDLVDARKQLRRYLQKENQELNRRWLTVGFVGFVLSSRGHALDEGTLEQVGRWFRDMDVSISRAWAALRHTCGLLRAAVKADRNAYLDSLVKEVGLADIQHPKQLYQKVRKAFPKAASSRRNKFVALPAVELADGTLAPNNEAKAKRWCEYFAGQESGEQVSADAYSSAVGIIDQKRHDGGTVHFDPQLLPSLAAIEHDVLSLKRAKAAGQDGITAELLRMQPMLAARHLVSLQTKAILSLQEPIEWKGGSLFTLAKKASTIFKCERHRSILLSSITGKVYHRGFRAKIMPSLLEYASDLHGGVKSGIGVDTISLSVKCFQSYTMHHGQLPALVFYDVRAAYYQVLRETLTGAPLNDKVICALFHRLGVPAHAFIELREQLARLASLADCGCSEHAIALASEMLTGTWFRLDHFPQLVSTAAGVRPGDPLADVFFAVSFSAYVRAVQETLVHKGLQTALPAGKGEPPWQAEAAPSILGPASWADDFAAMHAATTPERLVHTVKAVTGVYLTHATANGIQLAFGADKTAAVFSPKVAFQEGLGFRFGEAETCLPIQDKITGCWHDLPVVQAYKHLGSVVTSAGTVIPEINFRFSQAAWSLKPLKHMLFANPSIGVATRRMLLQSLIVSKFAFSAAAIVMSTSSHWRLWAKLYTRLWGALQPKNAQGHRAHSYMVLHTAQAATPPLALAKARAGLLLRLLERGPATLRQLVFLQWQAAPEGSWLGQFIGDIRHVGLYMPAARTLLAEKCPISSLVAAIQDERTWWKRQINAAVKQCLLDLKAWQQDYVRRQSVPGTPPAALPVPVRLPFQCPFCDSSFALRKHLGTHIARRHGLPCPARLYAHHRTCVACLRYFHTIPRVQRHLKGSRKCLLRASRLLAPLCLQEVREVEQADAERQRKVKAGQWELYSAAPPPIQALGPAQPSREELRAWLQEDAPLTLLHDPVVDSAFLCWVTGEICLTTVEPPRTGTVSFWHKRIITSM